MPASSEVCAHRTATARRSSSRRIPRCREVVAHNRERLAEAQYDVQGRSLRELSDSARRGLLQLACAYTSQYRDVPDRWQRYEATNGTPFILSGHQPEMFHPGVWYKNFVLGGLAAADGRRRHSLADRQRPVSRRVDPRADRHDRQPARRSRAVRRARGRGSVRRASHSRRGDVQRLCRREPPRSFGRSWRIRWSLRSGR